MGAGASAGHPLSRMRAGGFGADNRPMQVPDTTDQRLTDLEIKLSFQEDALDQLNATIVRQQQAIDLLLREVRHLREQMPQDGGPRFLRAQDELPPHY